MIDEALRDRDEQKRWAVFLDRDGTIIEERNYLSNPDDVRLLPTVAKAIRRLNALNIPVIVISNQAGVARGYFSLDDVQRVHQRIDALLAIEGAKLDGYYVCPHHPTAGVNEYGCDCDCRKPRPGMLRQAAKEHTLDLPSSYMIGDKSIDVAAGEALGCKSILLLTGYGRESAEIVRQQSPNARVQEDLGGAVDFILREAGMAG